MSTAKPCDYDKIFDERRARAKARDYARKGLDSDAQRIVDLVHSRTSTGYSLLEIGGGIGEIQLELLRDGATRALNVELGTQWEAVAADLNRDRGLGDRIERRLGDFAREGESVAAADVVIMHRVVCCYPDSEALVTAAADHARSLLVMTFLVDRWWIRWGIAIMNALVAIQGNTFRSYAHATSAVLAAAQRQGMRSVEHRRGLIWQLIALERTG